MGKLHAVAPDEPTPQPMSVSEAAKDGNRRDLLIALRTRIAQSVESPSTLPRDLAALSNRLLEIVKELEAITAEGGGDDVSNAASTPDEKWASS
jgi:hypothetical protein